MEIKPHWIIWQVSWSITLCLEKKFYVFWNWYAIPPFSYILSIASTTNLGLPSFQDKNIDPSSTSGLSELRPLSRPFTFQQALVQLLSFLQSHFGMIPGLLESQTIGLFSEINMVPCPKWKLYSLHLPNSTSSRTLQLLFLRAPSVLEHQRGGVGLEEKGIALQGRPDPDLMW